MLTQCARKLMHIETIKMMFLKKSNKEDSDK